MSDRLVGSEIVYKRQLLASQNRALASVLATCLAPGFSGSCSRLNPGHTLVPCRVPPEEFESERSSPNHSFFQSGCSWPLRIVLSPQCWLHFWHQVSQDPALASVLATLRASVGSHPKSLNPSGHRRHIVFSNQDALGLSESCSRLSGGYISGTNLLRMVLSP